MRDAGEWGCQGKSVGFFHERVKRPRFFGSTSTQGGAAHPHTQSKFPLQVVLPLFRVEPGQTLRGSSAEGYVDPAVLCRHYHTRVMGPLKISHPSIEFKNQLRDGVAPIEACAFNAPRREFLAVDASVLRVWGLKRVVKTVMAPSKVRCSGMLLACTVC